jgi:uncharacterized protein
VEANRHQIVPDVASMTQAQSSNSHATLRAPGNNAHAPADGSQALGDAAPPAPSLDDCATPAYLPSPIFQPMAPGPWIQIGSARGFDWTRVTLPIAGLSPALDGLRILHLTDMHARRFWDPAYDDLIAGVAKSPPDFLLFTGDFVDAKHDFQPALPTVGRLFSALSARLGKFAILGNHDSDLVGAAAGAWGVTMLDQRRLVVQSPHAAVELIGLPGVSREDLKPRFIKSLPPKQPGMCRIALSHFPDMIRRTPSLCPDLYLCGHTHGGQVCLPNGRPLVSHDSLPRRFSRGIHFAYATWIVTNRGLGFSSYITMRLFCPAEVIEITLTTNGVKAV